MSHHQKEITATQFKARCLRLLDEVAETGESLVVTKHGRPVARVEPPLRPDDLRGSVKINMSDEELIYFSMGPWDMESDAVEHDARLVTADRRLRDFDAARAVW